MYCRTRRCIIWNRELRRRGEHVEKDDAHFRWKPTSEGTNAAGANPGALRCYTRKDMYVCAANATVSLAHRPMWVCPQLTRVPPISIDLEQRVLYSAFRCAYIINVLPSPRREGNYVWATFSALARTLDSRSVEIGRSFYHLSIIFYLVHC